jgi:hypothetical protein
VLLAGDSVIGGMVEAATAAQRHWREAGHTTLLLPTAQAIERLVASWGFVAELVGVLAKPYRRCGGLTGLRGAEIRRLRLV